MSSPRVVALGELLLRLKSPGRERLMQSGRLEATFGGAEANVAATLASDGIDCAFVSALTNNPLGDAAIGELRRFGIDASNVVREAGRLGTYYLEAGAGQRSGRVVYDRENSVFANVAPIPLNWSRCFEGATWLHVSGITPAFSESAATICLDAVTGAQKLRLTVSCDYNFRDTLWRYGKNPPDVMRAIVEQVHVGVAGRGDCQTMLGIIPKHAERDGALNVEWYRVLAEQASNAFPNLDLQVITLREGNSATNNGWAGCLHNRKEFLVSKRYEIADVVDHVGAGHSFTVGLIYALIQKKSAQYALEFATAARCRKHTIVGDVNRVSAAEVEALMGGQGGGRMQRQEIDCDFAR